jgi:hypothetical protein
MFFPRFLRFRFFTALLPVLAIAAISYAFAAANTVPQTNAGDGEGTISGYTISNVHYTLNATNPANIDSVSFTISPAVPANGKVYVKLVSTGTTYTDCTISGGTNVTCNVTGVTALQADQLRVIAAQ